METEQNKDEAQTESQQGSNQGTEQQKPDKNKDYEESLRQIARQVTQQEERRIKLEEELAEARRKLEEKNAPPEEELTSADMLNNPNKFIDALDRKVSRRFEDSIKPLNDFRNQFQQTSELERIKNKFRKDPKFADILTYAEHIVDEGMAKAQPTEANMRALLVAIKGAEALGEFTLDIPEDVKKQRETNTNRSTGTNQMNEPAHLRPNPPAAPRNQQPSKTTRQPNELEKRLMRENGFKTFDEFLEWQNMDSTIVPHTDYGIPPKQGK